MSFTPAATIFVVDGGSRRDQEGFDGFLTSALTKWSALIVDFSSSNSERQSRLIHFQEANKFLVHLICGKPNSVSWRIGQSSTGRGSSQFPVELHRTNIELNYSKTQKRLSIFEISTTLTRRSKPSSKTYNWRIELAHTMKLCIILVNVGKLQEQNCDEDTTSDVNEHPDRELLTY